MTSSRGTHLYHSSLHAVTVRSSSLPIGGLQEVHPASAQTYGARSQVQSSGTSVYASSAAQIHAKGVEGCPTTATLANVSCT